MIQALEQQYLPSACYERVYMNDKAQN